MTAPPENVTLAEVRAAIAEADAAQEAYLNDTGSTNQCAWSRAKAEDLSLAYCRAQPAAPVAEAVGVREDIYDTANDAFNDAYDGAPDGGGVRAALRHVVDCVLAEFDATHPAPAAGGVAVAGVVTGWLPKQRVIEVRLDEDVPGWLAVQNAPIILRPLTIVEGEANPNRGMAAYNASISPDTPNRFCRHWSELSQAERDNWNQKP